MISVGVVIQRYGKDVTGAAGTLARNVAERLRRLGARTTVFTTCARDPLAWGNEHPSGESLLQGVRVRRFPTVGAGPDSPDLVAGLVAAQREIDLFLFFSCSAPAALEGIPALSKPVILFPLVQDGLPACPPATAGVWIRPRALFFLTGAEMDVVQRQFAPPGRMRLVRIGVETRAAVDEAPLRRRFQLIAPYLLYAGRIEPGRGLEALFDHHRAVRQEAFVDLVLIGEKRMDLPAFQGVKCLGVLRGDERLAAFQGALLSVQPAARESLSLATLESFAARTPALVDRRFPVLLEHVEASNAGLAYDGVEEFLAGFRRIQRRPALRQRLGERGLEHVQRYYSWETVMGEIQAGIAEVLEKKKTADVRR
ncbi:MAG: glycosyltransferase family 4 protein [Acidobacteria bacterium]|jgi:glycosyltransferase involved in cell wall biosynthesis|nr:glycosyltransferase family 4 protein [Acidobacteriota bacterium]